MTGAWLCGLGHQHVAVAGEDLLVVATGPHAGHVAVDEASEVCDGALRCCCGEAVDWEPLRDALGDLRRDLSDAREKNRALQDDVAELETLRSTRETLVKEIDKLKVSTTEALDALARKLGTLSP